MPPFNEKTDDIDAYLGRFERFTTNMKWSRDEWMMPLSGFLTSKALDVYSRLPDDPANSYSDLKTAILHRYELTEAFVSAQKTVCMFH